MSFAFVFPGQGSQSVGMLASLSDAPAVRGTFEEASGVLGYDLWKLVQEGPREQLDSTERTQPAMLAAGIALWRLWRERGGPEPAVVSGHSLGEFTALTCAGALDFSAAIELVRFRGQAMQEATPAGAGAMAAILGLEDAQVEAACRDAAQGAVVEAVNFNSPGQVVIAGERAAVQRAIELGKGLGAKRAIELPVSVPSHCSLMRGAGQRLGERLASMEVRAPRLRYLSPVDVAFHEHPADIRTHLTRQLSSPVQWTRTIKTLAEQVGQIVECGPGRVLTALNRRIDRRPGLDFLAVEDAESLSAALKAVQGGTAGAEHA
ncbi:MAG TPA: ACP S-malonyltransferase [Steroidobacteraceae bacterium]|nr:ACP S-malonyltransferase [Steroidobacteraceae bacterium]